MKERYVLHLLEDGPFSNTFIGYWDGKRFGYVTIPEWYEREPFSFEPFPVEEVISYWIKRDLVFSFLTALLTFCCCLLGSLIGTKTKFRRQQGGC
jgi:hypothetical protein